MRKLGRYPLVQAALYLAVYLNVLSDGPFAPLNAAIYVFTGCAIVLGAGLSTDAILRRWIRMHYRRWKR